MENHHPSSDPARVLAVIEAGFRGDPRLVLDGLNDDHPRVRLAAAGAALRLELLDEMAILRLLSDIDPTVRRRAAELAARRRWQPHPPARVIGALIARCDDEWRVAEMSAFALGELGTPDARVAAALEQMARDHTDPLCRESAVAALGSLGIGRETVLFALSDRAAVRRRAVLALAPFDGPDIDEALHRSLTDRDWQVRQAAEDLLDPPQI